MRSFFCPRRVLAQTMKTKGRHPRSQCRWFSGRVSFRANNEYTVFQFLHLSAVNPVRLNLSRYATKVSGNCHWITSSWILWMFLSQIHFFHFATNPSSCVWQSQGNDYAQGPLQNSACSQNTVALVELSIWNFIQNRVFVVQYSWFPSVPPKWFSVFWKVSMLPLTSRCLEFTFLLQWEHSWDAMWPRNPPIFLLAVVSECTLNQFWWATQANQTFGRQWHWVIFLFMGSLIVCSFEALMFLEQRFERTHPKQISQHEIWNFGWQPDADDIALFQVG